MESRPAAQSDQAGENFIKGLSFYSYDIFYCGRGHPPSLFSRHSRSETKRQAKKKIRPIRKIRGFQKTANNPIFSCFLIDCPLRGASPESPPAFY